jgi:hypothetical protein
MEIEKYIETIKKGDTVEGFEDGLLDKWSSSIKSKVKNYKSDALNSLESNKKYDEERKKNYEHEIINCQRRIISLDSTINKQKLEDKKSKEAILKRISDSNKEFEKIKSLPLTSLVTVDSPIKGNDLPIFIATTELLKTTTLSEEEIKSRCRGILAKRRLTRLFNKEIGKFIIFIDFNDLRYRAFNITQSARESYDHPCISNGSICFGNKSETFHQLLRDYKLFDCFDLIIDLITAPITGGPYIEWPQWFTDVKKTDIKRIVQGFNFLVNRNEINDSPFFFSGESDGLAYATPSGVMSNRHLSVDTERTDEPSNVSENILEQSRDLIESRVREMLESFQNNRSPSGERVNTPARVNGATASNTISDEVAGMPSIQMSDPLNNSLQREPFNGGWVTASPTLNHSISNDTESHL